jgi:hypothetical protein
MPTIEEITPAQDELGRLNPKYIERVGPLLPNFPHEVLTSWFGEQPDTVKAFAPLDYERFKFELEHFDIDKLPGQEVLREGSKTLKVLEEEAGWKKRGLMRWMEANKTWPVPPVLLKTDNSVIAPECTLPLRTPYHLLEGYHRLALAHRFVREGLFTDPLPFWVVRIPKPTSA